MNRVVELASAAADDLTEGWLWYEDQRDGLGDAFIFAAEETIRKISARPESFVQVEERIRRALVRRFPYAVYFSIRADRITVLAVLHTSRHPDEWRKRL